MFKKVYLYISIILIIALLCTGITARHYKNKYDRLVEQHRVELELARSRTEQYESIYRQARETNRELGECLSKSAATLSGLRLQISEVRTRYEKMEDLLNSVGNYDSNIRPNDSNNDSSYEVQ